MTSKVLAEIMTTQGGFDRDGDTLTAEEGVAAALFASIGAESLVIDRLVAVELGGEVLVATTAKKERFAIAYEDVRALRFSPRSPGAGY